MAATAETHCAATAPVERLGEPRVESRDCLRGDLTESGSASQRWVRAG